MYLSIIHTYTHLLNICTRHDVKCYANITSFVSHPNTIIKIFHFTDRKMEAQRG